MQKKKFLVIEEGNLSFGEMGKIMGGALCNPESMYTCNSTAKYGDCTGPMNYSCQCRTNTYSTACVNLYSQCGIVNGCGGSAGCYDSTTPCPTKKATALEMV